MREELIGIDQPEAWNAALAGLPHGFHHTWACCGAAHANTGLPTYLYSAEQDGVRVVCPIAERRHAGFVDWTTPIGFSGFASNGAWPGFAAQWIRFARSHGAVCAYLAQHPAFGVPEIEALAGSGTSLYFLDLDAGSAAVLAHARKGRRRELRAWQASGNAHITDRARLEAFALAHHGAFMRRVQAAAAARLNEAALRELLRAPGTLLLGAGRAAGQVDAVLLVGSTPWGAEGLFNVGTEHGRQHTVALLARAVEILASQGVPWLNLGGGVRERDAIAAAKREWNPRVAQMRRLKQVFRPDDFVRLCRQAGLSADDDTGYFPPYQRPAG